jgi:hypothetical protein
MVTREYMVTCLCVATQRSGTDKMANLFAEILREAVSEGKMKKKKIIKVDWLDEPYEIEIPDGMEEYADMVCESLSGGPAKIDVQDMVRAMNWAQKRVRKNKGK